MVGTLPLIWAPPGAIAIRFRSGIAHRGVIVMAAASSYSDLQAAYHTLPKCDICPSAFREQSCGLIERREHHVFTKGDGSRIWSGVLVDNFEPRAKCRLSLG